MSTVYYTVYTKYSGPNTCCEGGKRVQLLHETEFLFSNVLVSFLKNVVLLLLWWWGVVLAQLWGVEVEQEIQGSVPIRVAQLWHIV